MRVPGGHGRRRRPRGLAVGAASVGDVSLFAAARPCGNGVVVVVEDQGVWSPPGADPGFRGRGLDLVRELSHHHTVMGSELGTTVRMCWRALVTS